MNTATDVLEDVRPGRAILKCRTCKHAGSVSYTLHQSWDGFLRVGGLRILTEDSPTGRPYTLDVRRSNPIGWAVSKPCTACGSPDVKVSVVAGTVVASKACDGRCMGATGPNCECECGGENHGASHGGF